MPTGPVTNRALINMVTSAGTIQRLERPTNELSYRDILDIVYSAARKRDGAFTLAASGEIAGGITLTVTTNAGVTTIGPFPFPRESVAEAVDYVKREGKTMDGL